MIHRRRLIRADVCAALVAANTAAGSRVHDHPWNERTTFPALVVEDIGEQQQVTTMGIGAARLVERELLLQVSAELQPADDWARARDDLMADIEAAVAGVVISGVKAIEPAGYSADEAAFGARPIVVGRQRFSITYITPMNNPAAVL